MIKRVRGVSVTVALVQVVRDSAAIAQGAVHARNVLLQLVQDSETKIMRSVQWNAVDHDTKQRRVLARDSRRHAAALRLAVVVEFSCGTCMASTRCVKCGTFKDVSIAHVRVAVAEERHGIEGDANRAHQWAGVLCARARFGGVDTNCFGLRDGLDRGWPLDGSARAGVRCGVWRGLG